MKTLHQTHLVSGHGPSTQEIRCFKILDATRSPKGEDILNALENINDSCPYFINEFIHANRSNEFAQLIKDVCQYDQQVKAQK